MIPRTRKRKVSEAPERPHSSSVGKPWFKQVSDSLFHAAVSGSKCRAGVAAQEAKVPQPTCDQSQSKVSRNFLHVMSPVQQESVTSLRPPGMDVGLLWRKLMKEKHRSRNLQIEVGELKTTLEQCRKTVTEKSIEIEAKNNEIDSKNKLLSKLIEDKTKIEASIDVIEEEVDIDNLLHANLDLSMKDILDLTDVTFPADLIDLDVPDLDIKNEHINHVSLPPMNLGTSTMIGSQDLDKMIPNREERFQMDLGGEKEHSKAGNTSRSRNVCNFSVKVSSFKVNKEDYTQHFVKKRKQVGNNNQSSFGSPSTKRLNFSPSAPQSISCPHCGKTYPRGKQWKLVEHISNSHKNVITYACQFCDKQFSCQAILEAHTLRHQVTHPWHCGKCGYKPIDIKSFIKHVKSEVQVHTGELLLADYKWSLKNWQGELLATQHFMISSEGKAAEDHPESMGRYTLMKNMVTNGHHPVYKHDEEEGYIFMNADGQWGVSDVAGFEECFLRQNSDFSPSPCKTIPWEFWDDNFNGWEGDVSLRVYPCF